MKDLSDTDEEQATEAPAPLGERVERSLTRRGYLRQAKRREEEIAARRAALEHVHRSSVLQGGGMEDIARALEVSARAIRRWAQLDREGKPLGAQRGRAALRASPQEREAVIRTIEAQGPQLGLEPLWRAHRKLPREEVRAILGEYREKYAEEHPMVVSELSWLLPGGVWAMDHTKPPSPIDGDHKAVLSVRDLSSGAQLLWQGESGPRASEVVRDIEALFLTHAPPLVLKCDNGSAFIATALEDLCLKWEVLILWSPPRTPRYNGAIESGIRWMQHRTEHRSTTVGRPGEWKAQDLRTARERTNELPKDSRASTKPRGEVFSTRAGITPEARAAFQGRAREERARERSARGIAPDAALKRHERAEIDRQALCRALVALGYLTITKRVVPLPLNFLPAARIS